MDFTTMSAAEYRGLNADKYQERRAAVLAVAEAIPEDATEEQVRSIDAELGYIKDEDSRRDAIAALRNRRAAAVVSGMGKVVAVAGGEDARESRDMSLGARVVREMGEKGYTKGTRFAMSNIAFRAAGDPTVTGVATSDYTDALTEHKEDILEGYRRQTVVADLFNQEATEKDAVSWYVEGAVEGDAGMTAENGEYSKLTVATPTKVTASLKKATALWRMSDEVLSDAPRLVTNVNGRANYLLDVKIEDQLVSGDGAGDNITGLSNTDGLLAASVTSGYGYDFIDSLLDQRTAIMTATPNFQPDAILLALEDYDALMKLRDSNGQYVLGGPTGFVYGNGVTIGKSLWNTITIVPTAALASGTSILGAFKQGATLIRHVEGRRFDVGYDGEDFSHGRVSFRSSERFVLAVEYPGAFCKYTVTTA